MGRFSFWLGMTGLVLGAIFGAIDLEFLGAIVGGLVGGFAGALIGEVFDLIIGPFLGSKGEHRVGKWIIRIIGLAMLVVFLHELYWAVNLVSLTAAHNIGARITQRVAKGDNKQAVQDMLKDKRWQVSLFTMRPVRWGLKPDIYTNARTTLDLVDDVANNKMAVDQALHSQGKDVAAHSENLIDKYVPQTWLLHFLPREVLIPKE
jgi:hypothetical protein